VVPEVHRVYATATGTDQMVTLDEDRHGPAHHPDRAIP